MNLRYKSPKALRDWVEELPSGPHWKSITMKTAVPTKSPIVIYYRNPVECLQSLLRNPLFKDHISFCPYCLYKSAAKTTRTYTEWLSGDAAWNMQVCQFLFAFHASAQSSTAGILQTALPRNGTLLGTIIASDKTTISAMTGNRAAHPLLISLANISMDFRNKASNEAFLLLGLIPIPKFIHKKRKICSVLEARLFHECLDHILRPLKSAATTGVLMADSLGQNH